MSFSPLLMSLFRKKYDTARYLIENGASIEKLEVSYSFLLFTDKI